MEFFVFYYPYKSQAILFQLRFCELDTPISKIVSLCTDRIREKIYSDFQPEKAKVYYQEILTNTENGEFIEISNLDTPISKLPVNSFDLILSYEKPECEHPTNIKKEFQPVTENERAILDKHIADARAAIQKKNFNAALAAASQARQITSRYPELATDPRPLYLIIEVMLKVHRFQQAALFATSVLNWFPNDRIAQYYYAKVAQKLENHEEAIRLFQMALMIPGPNSEIIHLSMIKSYLALNRMSDAIRVMDQIYPSFRSNEKIVLMKCTLLVKNNQFPLAVHELISNLTWSASRYPLQKFIRRFVKSPRTVALFTSELGDCSTNPRVLFYIANLFYQYGRCNLGSSLFAQAFAFDLADASMTLRYLKNEIALCSPATLIISISCSFFSQGKCIPSGKESPYIPLLTAAIPDTQLPPVTEVNCKPFKFEKEPSPFTIGQLDSISVVFTLCMFFFNRGFIGLTESLINIISPLIQPFDLTQTLIGQEATTFSQIATIVSTLARPIQQTDKKIYLIGDTWSLPLAWRKIGDYLIQPMCIENLQMFSFDENEESPARVQLNHYIEQIPEGSKILLHIGRSDCTRTQMDLLNKIDYDKIEDAMARPVDTFIDALSIIQSKKHFDIKIYLTEPVEPVKKFSKLLNTLIMKRLSESPVENVAAFDISLDVCKEDGSFDSRFMVNDMLMTQDYFDVIAKYVL